MIKKTVLGIMVIGALAIGSCTTDAPPSVPPITAPAVTLPTVSGVDGYLLAVKTRTKESSTDITTGTASAGFFKNQSPLTKVDAGILKLNGKELIKADDNTYFFAPSAADPLGLVFGSQINWQGVGNASTGVPVISDNDGSGFPNFPLLSEFVTFDKTQDKVLDYGTSPTGDSVIVIIKGPSATYKKTQEITMDKITIPKAEIAKLGTGGGSVLIVRYVKADKTVGAKKYAFIKQTNAYTAKVTFK